MNPTDTLALSQHITGLDKTGLQQAATSLAAQNSSLAADNATKTTQIAQLTDWIKKQVPTHVSRPARVGIGVGTGTAVGVAYGLLPWPWSLLGSACLATGAAVVATMAEKPDWKDAALAITTGAAATAAGIEACKGTSEYMAKRAATKGAAVASAAPANTNAKKTA